MTEEPHQTSEAPAPPPQASAPPYQAPAPPYQAPAPPPSAGWQAPPPAAVAGVPGFVYADVPNRIIALIIDAIIIAILGGIIGAVLGVAGLKAGLLTGGGTFDFVATLIFAVIGFAISFGYFFYSWTVRRATLGMSMLGMQVGNAYDGKTLTQDQAIRRAIALWGPGLLSYFLGTLPVIGPLIGLASLIWTLYLLYTTYQSPTKQGFHDKFANSVVVKSMRVA